jgi:alpha-beta hydrolase superfamily lysophospholipase
MIRISFLRSRSKTRTLLLGATLLSALWIGASAGFVKLMTRRPRAWFAEPAPTVVWASFEEHQIRTCDGETLGAWLHRGESGAASVLVLHGHRGSRRNGLASAEFFAGQGCSVLLVSQRAHGDSTGEYNDFGYSARHDVVAAVEFLEKQRPGLPVVVNGVSMGAAAAVFAADVLGARVHGYLLESPYRDLHRATRNRVQKYLPPLLDDLAYAGLVAASPLVLPDVGRIAPIEHIAKIPPTVPVLILSGVLDKVAHTSEARELCDRAGAHAQLVLVEAAGHGSLIRADEACYRAAVLPFLRKATRPQ